MSENNGNNGLKFPGVPPAGLPMYADLVYMASLFGAAAQSGTLQRALFQAQDLAAKRRAGIPLQGALSRFEKVLADPNFWAMYNELISLIQSLPRTEATAGKYLGLRLSAGVLPDITAPEIAALVRMLPAAPANEVAPAPADGDGEGGGRGD